MYVLYICIILNCYLNIVLHRYFLSEGYHVIFLHRKGSLEPYKRHFTHLNFLDLLEQTEANSTVKSKTKWGFGS